MHLIIEVVARRLGPLAVSPQLHRPGIEPPAVFFQHLLDFGVKIRSTREDG